MLVDTKIHISQDISQKINLEVERLRIKSKKKYADACINFFSSRGLNPLKYQPTTLEDTYDLLEKSIETIMDNQNKLANKLLDYLSIQEGNLLKPIMFQVFQGNAATEVTLELLTNHMSKNDEDQEFMRRKNNEIIKKKIKAAVERAGIFAKGKQG